MPLGGLVDNNHCNSGTQRYFGMDDQYLFWVSYSAGIFTWKRSQSPFTDSYPCWSSHRMWWKYPLKLQ